jgi:hypothetical protein
MVRGLLRGWIVSFATYGAFEGGLELVPIMERRVISHLGIATLFRMKLFYHSQGNRAMTLNLCNHLAPLMIQAVGSQAVTAHT